MQYRESQILQDWYAANKRDLPWRGTKDPYLIWISEIILQQTRVVQGMDYYNRFVRRFPDIQHLAEAEQVEVLKFWQGLGYYSRARNLHEAAQTIYWHLNGVFPNRYDELLALKGIGEYTAAAIVSLAWNQPYPVVDGNVYRVLGRLFAIETPVDTAKGQKEYREVATLLMPPEKAGLHNQAIMEFGALQCVPHHPDCVSCPFSATCAGYASGNVHQYPVKQNKTKTRDRYLNYFFILLGRDTYINRRTGKDIWEGLYELPLIETKTPMDITDLQNEAAFRQLFDATGQPVISLKACDVKHILSHQILHANCYQVEIQKENATLKQYLKIPVPVIDEYPFPKLISTFFNYLK
jgi:A/G-specific adenine glycosylase